MNLVEWRRNLKRLHELVVLGGSDPHVGVDDRSLAHCLTADVLLSVLVPEGAVDLQAPPGGRGVEAGDGGGVIVFV